MHGNNVSQASQPETTRSTVNQMASPLKVALVTASSAGLGAAAGKGLAAAGFRVVINYNSNKQKADQVIQDIRGTDPRAKCVAFQADVSNREQIEQLVESTVSYAGRLDAVVSNQGWTRMRDFANIDDNMDESDWDQCFQMNVKSHLWLFHAARPHLARSKGSFTTVASLAGVIPSGSSWAYSVSKAAQIHLVKILAKTAAPDIRVNSVSPGILLTVRRPTQFPSRHYVRGY